jgi:Domain of unknown function (DUF4190)
MAEGHLLPGGSHGTSRLAIASVACGAGALVLAGLIFAFYLAAIPVGWFLVVLQILVFCACPAAFVLGIVALVQIRRTGRGGTGLAVTGMVLGCAVPLLWLVFALVAMGIACGPQHGC